MQDIKLSEFVKLSYEKMLNHISECDLNFKKDQIKPSVHKSSKCYDTWSKLSNFHIIEDECDWQVVPFISHTFYLHDDNDNIVKSANEYNFQKDILRLKKVSKYGELVYVSITKCDKAPKIVFNSINDNHNYPIIVLNNEEMPKYFEGLPLKYNTRYEVKELVDYNSQHKNSISEFVVFPYLPGNISLAEYGKAVEDYAKIVSEQKDLYKSNKDVISKLNFAKHFNESRWEEESFMSIPDTEYTAYMSLKYMYPDLTPETYNKLYKVITSESTEIIKYIKDIQKYHKNKYYVYDNSNAYRYADEHFYNSYGNMYANVILTFNVPYLGILSDLLKDFDKVKGLLNSSVNVKKLQETAKKEYLEKRKKLSNSYGKELALEYLRIKNSLAKIEKKYNEAFSEINKEISEKYSSVRLDRIIDNENPIDLTYGIKKNLKFIAEESASIENSDAFDKVTGLDKIPANFKKLVQEAFDFYPDAEHIVLAFIKKSEDAPYEVWGDTGFYENNSDIYDKMVEAWGEKKADKWVEKFDKYDYSDQLNEDDGNDLYPGCSRAFILNRDFEFDFQDYDD